MHNSTAPAYGLWGLVLLHVVVLVGFAYSFTRPQSRRDWRQLGAFAAFVVALYTEMYGIPVTIYLLSGILQRRFPDVDLLAHDLGHLWYPLLGGEGNPHTHPLHLLANALVLGGTLLIAVSWKVLYEAQEREELATTGMYGRIRHPQYLGFIATLTGFLLMWPTLLTLLMYPVLVVMYVRLARAEEQEMARRFGSVWDNYRRRVPGWFPRIFGSRETEMLP